jgi:hypothetical protein
MSFWAEFGKGLSLIAGLTKGVEESVVMTAAQSEPNAMVRQQKVQMTLQLRNTPDLWARQQMINSIYKR